MAPPPTDLPPLKILMLHGFTQSGPLFAQKTGALKKCLVKAFPTHTVSLHYPTAPHRLRPADIPGFDALREHTDGTPSADADADVDAWAWFQRSTRDEPCTYTGFDEGLAHIAGVIRAEGPFDGVIGFSQGAFVAATLAGLLETQRPAAFAAAEGQGGMPFPEVLRGVQGPLRFAVSYSGFAATQHALYRALSEPKIETPVLHFIGSVDTVVSEERSLRLVEGCVMGEGRGKVVYHPGGHFVPASQKVYQAALLDFIREVLGGGGDGKQGREEEKAEDMDMPF